MNVKLTNRQESTLREIAKYSRRPTASLHGYSKFWTPKTNEKLAELGLVEFVEHSVVITDEGLKIVGVITTS